MPARNVQELVALAKAGKPSLSFASSGNAPAPHLAGEAFKVAIGASSMQHIPYKGSSPALTDLVGGQVQLMFDSLPSSQPFIKSGALRDGVWAPAGTPPAVVQRLSREIAAIVRLPDVRQQFQSFGAEPVGNTLEQFSAFTRSELEKWAQVVKSRARRSTESSCACAERFGPAPGASRQRR